MTSIVIKYRGNDGDDSLSIRFAVEADIGQLLELEHKCWVKNLRADEDQIRNCINRNPLGNFVLDIDGQLSGVLYTQRIKNKNQLLDESFQMHHRLAVPNGPVLQLLSIAVNPDIIGYGNIGAILRDTVTALHQGSVGVREIVAMTRCSNYLANYPVKSRSFVTYEEWVLSGKDPTIWFHMSGGAQVVRVVRAYRPNDRANLGHAVLISYGELQQAPAPCSVEESMVVYIPLISPPSLPDRSGAPSSVEVSTGAPALTPQFPPSCNDQETSALEQQAPQAHPKVKGLARRICRQIRAWSTAPSKPHSTATSSEGDEEKPQGKTEEGRELGEGEEGEEAAGDGEGEGENELQGCGDDDEDLAALESVPLMNLLDSFGMLSLHGWLEKLMDEVIAPQFLFKYSTAAAIQCYFEPSVNLPSSASVASTTRQVRSNEPVAIVGLACKLPGEINSAEELWNALESMLSTLTAYIFIGKNTFHTSILQLGKGCILFRTLDLLVLRFMLRYLLF